jgi:hypothetical protein
MDLEERRKHGILESQRIFGNPIESWGPQSKSP